MTSFTSIINYINGFNFLEYDDNSMTKRNFWSLNDSNRDEKLLGINQKLNDFEGHLEKLSKEYNQNDFVDYVQNCKSKLEEISSDVTNYEKIENIYNSNEDILSSLDDPLVNNFPGSVSARTFIIIWQRLLKSKIEDIIKSCDVYLHQYKKYKNLGFESNIQDSNNGYDALGDFNSALFKANLIETIDSRLFTRIFLNQEIKKKINWKSNTNLLNYLIQSLFDNKILKLNKQGRIPWEEKLPICFKVNGNNLKKDDVKKIRKNVYKKKHEKIDIAVKDLKNTL